MVKITKAMLETSRDEMKKLFHKDLFRLEENWSSPRKNGGEIFCNLTPCLWLNNVGTGGSSECGCITQVYCSRNRVADFPVPSEETFKFISDLVNDSRLPNSENQSPVFESEDQIDAIYEYQLRYRQLIGEIPND